MEMKLSKSQLYKAFSVLGNLADKSGEITVTIHGENLAADATWVRNAITEPLSEAGIDFDVKEE